MTEQEALRNNRLRLIFICASMASSLGVAILGYAVKEYEPVAGPGSAVFIISLASFIGLKAWRLWNSKD